MTKTYTFLRIRPETNIQLNDKQKKMNDMLKNLGFKCKTIKKINIIDMLSKKPIVLDTKELLALAKSVKNII